MAAFEPRRAERLDPVGMGIRWLAAGSGGIGGKENDLSEVGVESSMAVPPPAAVCCCD